MLTQAQAEKLRDAGLDYYNHNVDTDAEFYGQVVTTHTHADRIDTIGQVRAAARICMPASWVRLSAGREAMSEELQALCFLAGANSAFYGDKLLTAANPEMGEDKALFQRLGLRGV